MTERLGAALERAAERVATMRKMYDAKYSARIEQIAHLAGWAEAIRALTSIPCVCAEYPGPVDDQGHRFDCPAQDAAKAIASFIKAMLGGGDD